MKIRIENLGSWGKFWVRYDMYRSEVKRPPLLNPTTLIFFAVIENFGRFFSLQ